jgi:hypothetical protein
MSNKRRSFIDSTLVVAAGVFGLKAAAQGIIGWLAARLFSKWWNRKGENGTDSGLPSSESTKKT